MSRVLWREALVPGPEAPTTELSPEFFGERGIRIENVIPLPLANTDIEIPDRRAYRSMSRAAVLMSAVCLKAKYALAPYLAKDPFRVGMYCAVDAGPIDYPSTFEAGQAPREEFHEKFKKLRTPKMYLKQLPNLAPAQIGIFLGIQGPLCVYTHSTAAGIQALEQAERDLRDKVVDAALVCGALSFEDSLQTLRARQQLAAKSSLAEGAGALVLISDDELHDWAHRDYSDQKRSYGMSQPIVQAAQGRI